MTLTPKTTHVAEARARLLEQFKGKPRIEAFVEAFATQAQAGEDASWGLYVERWLSSSVGAQLDGIGDIAGEPRRGKNDATYRFYLAARILVNLSNGTGDELLEILAVIAGPDRALAFVDLWPAAFAVYLGNSEGLDLETVVELIREAKAAGVGVSIISAPTADDGTFCFADGDEEQASETQGWADDAQTTGGALADVVGV